MNFFSGYKEERRKNGDDLAFVFCGSEMLVKGSTVPSVEEFDSIDLNGDGLFFGTSGDRQCYAYSLPETEKVLPEGRDMEYVLLRQRMTALSEGIAEAAGYASHLVFWNNRTIFCGQCGTENLWHDHECAKICPSCGNIQFPKISPAIIIAVVKDGKLLLAHNRRFPEGRYSLLAGFMEMGETIEETAAREVREEAGIEIDNIRYLSSQSWPFPDSLMIGLIADYKSGEITPDGDEIVDADWYSPENFPSIPGPGTIARKIIDRYTKTYKA